jgi:hypothetical protein
MSSRALKSFAVVLSLVACANEVQEIGGPEDSSGGSGSGASGGEASGGSAGSPTGGSGSSGGTGGGSGGTGGKSGAFGGSEGLGGKGGTTGGSSGAAGGGTGGTAGGAGGAGGAAGGAGGSGGSGGTPADCATAKVWVSGMSATPAIPVGTAITYMDKLYIWKGNNMGTGDLMYFHPDCPPEGMMMSWCSMQYVYELVGPCE